MPVQGDYTNTSSLFPGFFVRYQACGACCQQDGPVDFSEDRFNEIVKEYKEFIAPLNIPDVTCIPLSALDGDNVVVKSERTPWYAGISLLDFLETVHIDNDHNLADFRFPGTICVAA